MKRGNLRIVKDYKDKKIKFKVQGRKNKIWYDVTDNNKDLIFDTKEEAIACINNFIPKSKQIKL